VAGGAVFLARRGWPTGLRERGLGLAGRPVTPAGQCHLLEEELPTLGLAPMLQVTRHFAVGSVYQSTSVCGERYPNP